MILIIACASCKGDPEIKGKEFIPRDDLVNILTDMHLMDAITNDMSYYRKFSPSDSIDLHSAIFEKYNIDREMYQRTIREYSKYPGLLDKVYDDVLMKLQILQDEAEKTAIESSQNRKPDPDQKVSPPR